MDELIGDALPPNPTEWADTCCTAIKTQNREAALTCLELWDQSASLVLWDRQIPPIGTTNVLLTAMRHGFPLMVKKIIRRMPLPDMVPWRKLIECAVSNCHSTAMLQFLEIEFLSAPNNMGNLRVRWHMAIEEVTGTMIPIAVERGDCLAVRIYLRLSPSQTFNASVIIGYKTSPDLLWVVMSQQFKVSKGDGVWSINAREEALQCLAAVATSQHLRHPPITRAMARAFINRGSRELALSHAKKAGTGKFSPICS